MKTRTVAGLLVVAGIGIGALLNSIMPDLSGIGTGWSGIGNSTAKTTSPEIKKSTSKDLPETSEREAENAQTEPTGGVGGAGDAEVSPEVIYVVISGRDYLIRKDPDDRASQRGASLQQVVTAVQEATGDENGIRVRIRQLTTGRATALRALLDELDRAKIPRSAIRTKDEPVEE